MTLAFVSSSLPANILKLKMNEWGVKEIIISNKNLLNTYKFLISNSKDIKINCVPSGFKGIIYIAFKLIKTKIFKQRVFFFHECCWIIFDILINFINCKAYYFPQVSMQGFNEKKIHEITKEKFLMFFFRQKNFFKSYELIYDNDAGSGIVWSCIYYNKNIKINSLQVSEKIKSSYFKSDSKKIKNCLFLIGTDMVRSDNLIKIFKKLIKIFTDYDFKIYIKDHPNENNRLDLNGELKGNIIPPHVPVELIEDNFLFVIGCASSGLLNFKNRAYSILFCTEMTSKNALLRKKHLVSLPGGVNLNFLKKEDKNFSLIKKKLLNIKIEYFN